MSYESTHAFLAKKPWLLVCNGLLNNSPARFPPEQDVQSWFPLVGSFSNVISVPAEASLLRAIVTFARAMPPKPYMVGDPTTRSGQQSPEDPGVVHLGVWGLYQAYIYLTRETRHAASQAFLGNISVREALRAAIERFQAECPLQYEALLQAWDNSALGTMLEKYPFLGSLKPFSLMALNICPSYGSHVDPNDYPAGGLVLALGTRSNPLVLANGKTLLLTQARGISVLPFKLIDHFVASHGCTPGCTSGSSTSFRLSIVLTGHESVHAGTRSCKHMHGKPEKRSIGDPGQSRTRKLLEQIEQYLTQLPTGL